MGIDTPIIGARRSTGEGEPGEVRVWKTTIVLLAYPAKPVNPPPVYDPVVYPVPVEGHGLIDDDTFTQATAFVPPAQM
jgi:hypothetical protein